MQWVYCACVCHQTEFRFYWLHDKFQEAGGPLAEIAKINPVIPIFFFFFFSFFFFTAPSSPSLSLSPFLSISLSLSVSLSLSPLLSLSLSLSLPFSLSLCLSLFLSPSLCSPSFLTPLSRVITEKEISSCVILSFLMKRMTVYVLKECLSSFKFHFSTR